MSDISNKRFLAFNWQGEIENHWQNIINKMDNFISGIPSVNINSNSYYFLKFKNNDQIFIARSIVGNIPDYLLEGYRIIDMYSESDNEDWKNLKFSESLEQIVDFKPLMDENDASVVEIMQEVSDNIRAYSLKVASGPRVVLKYL